MNLHLCKFNDIICLSLKNNRARYLLKARVDIELFLKPREINDCFEEVYERNFSFQCNKNAQ